MGILVRAIGVLAVPALCVGAGWVAGAKYGLPEGWVAGVDRTIAEGRATVSPLLADGAERGRAALEEVVVAGGDYVTGTLGSMFGEARVMPEAAQGLEDATGSVTGPAPAETRLGRPREDAEEAELPAHRAVVPPRSTQTGTEHVGGGSLGIVICNMRVSNPPRGGVPKATIGRAGDTARIGGVELLLMPASTGCLSSGFGTRGGRMHRGIDYFSKHGGDVLAAGAGTVVEAVARRDYGNMLVIDHGRGVYTRYAHLARFDRRIHEGATVEPGQVLGPIGNTGATGVPHLHYEVLEGDIGTPAKSFGLRAVDPFGG